MQNAMAEADNAAPGRPNYSTLSAWVRARLHVCRMGESRQLPGLGPARDAALLRMQESSSTPLFSMGSALLRRGDRVGDIFGLASQGRERGSTNGMSAESV